MKVKDVRNGQDYLHILFSPLDVQNFSIFIHIVNPFFPVAILDLISFLHFNIREQMYRYFNHTDIMLHSSCLNSALSASCFSLNLSMLQKSKKFLLSLLQIMHCFRSKAKIELLSGITR